MARKVKIKPIIKSKERTPIEALKLLTLANCDECDTHGNNINESSIGYSNESCWKTSAHESIKNDGSGRASRVMKITKTV